MKIHHLNCATICMPRRVVGAPGAGFWAKMVCHCLLIEGPSGLILVDTGLGTRDVRNPLKRLGPAGAMLSFGGGLSEEDCAVSQVRKLGFRPEDVRDIVMTHLDVDHAGGLPDFPQARVHVYGKELDAAMARKTVLERERYFPVHWEHGPGWVRQERLSGERWFGFEAVRELAHLPPEILMIPLHGHTHGHCAVAVRSGDRWLVHAGDAYFFHDEMKGGSCPASLQAFQRVLAMDNELRLSNQARLRELAAREPVSVFCAHDPTDFARHRGA